jgi:hypothetical protein
MKKYALIKDNKIVKFKNVPDDDTVIVPKLLAHDYRIVKEQAIPEHDCITQTLSDTYEVQIDKVLRVWTVAERPFEEAKQAKKDSVEIKALDEIKEAFKNGNQQVKIDKAVSDKDVAVVKIEAAKNNADLRSITKAKAVK